MVAVVTALLAAWWLSALVLGATGNAPGALLVALAVAFGLPLGAGLWKHGLTVRRMPDVAGFSLVVNGAIAAACVLVLPDPLGAALREHGWAVSAAALGEQHRATQLSSMASYEVADALSEPTAPPVRVEADRSSIVVEIDVAGPAGSATLPYLWDTGATYTTITTHTAARLGVEIPADAPAAQMQTAAGDRDTALVVLPLLRVAGTEIRNVTVSICDDCEHDRTEGLLGLNAMRFLASQHDPTTGSLELTPRADAEAVSRVDDISPFLRIELEGSPDLVRGRHAHWVLNVHNDAPLPVSNVQIAAAFEEGATLLGTEIPTIPAGGTARTRVIGNAGRTANGQFRLLVNGARW